MIKDAVVFLLRLEQGAINSASLNRHIARTYRFSPFTNGFVEIIAAELTPDSPDWFQGTADAVRQSYSHIEDNKGETILILAGDHLYRMDYREFLRRHEETGADITVSVTAALEEDASGFGLLKIDDTGRIVAVITTTIPRHEIDASLLDSGLIDKVRRAAG